MNELMALNVGMNETFMSFTPETQEDKRKVYNAINNPEFKVADFINKEIRVKDIIAIGVELDSYNGTDNPFNGEKRKATRTILIDDEGRSYSATSDGIFTSVRTLYSVFGTLHFDDPIVVTVKQVKTKKGTLLTLSI